MLVLTRKLGQQFQVGGDIRVTIVKIDRNSVRIGIEAPDEVVIHRQEVADADRERIASFELDLEFAHEGA